MSYTQSSKRRVATATVALGLAGAGLLAAGFGDSDGTTSVSAARAGRPPAQATAGATHSGSGAELELAAGVSGWRSFKHWAVRSGDQQAVQAHAALSQAEPASQQDKQPAAATASDSDKRAVPRRITVILPTYSGGRAPEVGEPTVDKGTPPSVDPGWKTTVDLGTPASVQPPSVDRGEPGQLTPPSVETS